MPRKPKVNTQKLISLIQENKNTYEIAQELNVTPPTVKYWIKKLSLAYTRKRTWKLVANPQFKQKLIQLFNEGRSLGE
ncbi:MAG: hypothetical protein DRJ31_08485, partial [Candidatus Methanomethylicota archaeon]